LLRIFSGRGFVAFCRGFWKKRVVDRGVFVVSFVVNCVVKRGSWMPLFGDRKTGHQRRIYF
jgi:hypothetical protein